MSTQPHTRRTALTRLRSLVFMAFWAPALVGIAQTAINSGAPSNPLPLRNLLIEVRQVQVNRQDQQGVTGSASVELDSRGNTDAQVQLDIRNRQDQLTVTAQQQVLVINGRSASVALRSSTPLRLMQTRFRGGRPYRVPGVVLLDASTGFIATPRWDGSDMAELELGATQASPVMPGTRSVAGSSSASSVIVPLGEWVTVAESAMDSQGSGGGGTDSRQQRSELQVRLTVR